MNTPRLSAEHDAARQARDERHLRVLQELSEIGMELARAVHRQALEASGSEAAGLALTFARVGRAVRQTIALEARLAEDRSLRHEKRAAGLAAETRALGARRKKDVARLVARAIEAESADSDYEDLLDDLHERLDDDYDDSDFAERPVGELIARICRDLGVTPDPSLFEDADLGIGGIAARPSVGADPEGPTGEEPGPWPDVIWPGGAPPGKLS